MKIEKTVMLVFATLILCTYVQAFILIIFHNVIEGSLLLIAISICDKVNNDRFN